LKKIKKNQTLTRPKFGRTDIAKFNKLLMLNGKKQQPKGLFFDALTEIEIQSKKNPLEVIEKAIANVQPQVEVRSKRVGVPIINFMPVRGTRQYALACLVL
jgi:small subunit ribosomal protein S7